MAYWTANAPDAELRLAQQTAGNGVVTTQSFDAQTGRLMDILAGTGNIVQNFSYTYDVLGNVLTRADANTNLSETFTYDNLNRVTSATVSQSVAPVKTFTYDAIGNLLSKSDVGNYAYPLAGSALPHAVMSTSGGAVSTSFTYDPNGNQTSGLGCSIGYTSYNKPASITQGSSTLFFSDDTDHQRFKQVSPEGTTLYFNAFGVHAELFVAGTSRWYDFIGSGSMVGMRVLQPDNSVTTRYFQTDNLGSIAVITDESGNVVERNSYDAWGKRRFPNGADDPSGSLSSQTTRGYTGEEQLTDVGLVHLNGRVYDPLVGRMMSADPFVPDPMNGQAWNRYSYVINNPLALTDTNGYCFLGMCSWGKAISTFFGRTFGVLFRQFPILGSLFEIAATAICAPFGGPACAAVAAAATAFVTGVTSGSLGLALKAGFIAGVTAMANFAVGTITQGMDIAIEGLGKINPLNIAAHALVGCASAVASRGSCKSGALAAGISAAAAPFIEQQFPNPFQNPGNLAAGTAISSTIGGLASVAGGGKFANGAATGAFGYLFNAVMHFGGTTSVPSAITNGIAGFWRWLSGDKSFLMGNSISFGVVVQYPDVAGGIDKEVRNANWDIGLYLTISKEVAGLANFDFSFSPEFGVTRDTIHGVFDGKSISVNVDTPWWGGGSATWSQGDQGAVDFSGLAYRLFPGAGVSTTQNFTNAGTLLDLINWAKEK